MYQYVTFNNHFSHFTQVEIQRTLNSLMLEPIQVSWCCQRLHVLVSLILIPHSVQSGYEKCVSLPHGIIHC